MKTELQYGTRLREIRKAKGITQAELSAKSGIAINSISRYETNERQPTMDILTRIADALGMTVEELLWDKPTPIYFNNVPDKPIEEMTIEDAQKALEMAKEALNKFHDSLIDIYIDNDDFILSYYNELNSTGKKEALKRIRELTLLDVYTNKEEQSE